jgi:hypothetical protein
VEIVVAFSAVPGVDQPVTIECSADAIAGGLSLAATRFPGLAESTAVVLERSSQALTGYATVLDLALRDGDRLLLGEAANPKRDLGGWRSATSCAGCSSD